MWFRIVYINTVLFVCFVNAQIQDSNKDAKHEDTGNTGELGLNLCDLLVRLVNCSADNGAADNVVQVRVNGTWNTVCNESYLQVDNDKICNRARSSYIENATDIGETSVDTESKSTLFAKLRWESGKLCPPVTKANCPGGGVHLKMCPLKTGAVGGKYYTLSACSYPGDTVANCSGDSNLWMTYEHVFFHKRLPQTFIAWTSSYFKRTPCNQIDTGRCFNDSIKINATTAAACVNVCLDQVSTDLNTSLDAATFESHTNKCTCLIAPQACLGEQYHCTGDLYEVTTSKRNLEDSNLLEFCIAVQRSNGISNFTARPCRNLLPQLCGTHMCFPRSNCANNSPCEMTKDYLNFTCKCKDGFSGRHCNETVLRNVSVPDTAFPTTSFKPDLSSQSPQILVWVAAIVSAVSVILILVFFIFFIWCRRRPPGESQRPNSIMNRTYGESTHASHYEHMDDDDDTYDLLNEDNMNPRPQQESLNRGVLLLDDYSTPNDVVSNLKKICDEMTDYATTYDDPIRKLSEHEDAVQLNIDQIQVRSDKTKEQHQNDLEMLPLKHVPEFPERKSRSSSEGSKKNSFKRCLCSMNASAESDIETSGQLPNPSHVGKCDSGDLTCELNHIAKEPNPKDDVNTSDHKSPSSDYFTLAPTSTDQQVRQSAESSLTEDCAPSKETDVDSDYEDTSVVLFTTSSVQCDKTKHSFHMPICQNPHRGGDAADEDSDYEDTSCVASQAGRSRHVTMPGQGQECGLHSPPEVLMERLGIRIVPSRFTYETYMALPNSRADLMNPYYSNLNNISAQNSELNGDEEGSRDHSRGFDMYKPEVKEKTLTLRGNDACVNENEYDRLYGIKRSVQNQNSQNTYDHVLGSWNKHDARKRLNSY